MYWHGRHRRRQIFSPKVSNEFKFSSNEFKLNSSKEINTPWPKFLVKSLCQLPLIIYQCYQQSLNLWKNKINLLEKDKNNHFFHWKPEKLEILPDFAEGKKIKSKKIAKIPRRWISFYQNRHSWLVENNGPVLDPLGILEKIKIEIFRLWFFSVSKFH